MHKREPQHEIQNRIWYVMWLLIGGWYNYYERELASGVANSIITNFHTRRRTVGSLLFLESSFMGSQKHWPSGILDSRSSALSTSQYIATISYLLCQQRLRRCLYLQNRVYARLLSVTWLFLLLPRGMLRTHVFVSDKWITESQTWHIVIKLPTKTASCTVVVLMWRK